MALDYEQQFYSKKIQYIVGCDEAGRGCLLGDVFAGAVILPKDFACDLINDSKQLTEKQREEAFVIIKEHAIAWGVGRCTAEEIDEPWQPGTHPPMRRATHIRARRAGRPESWPRCRADSLRGRAVRPRQGTQECSRHSRPEHSCGCSRQQKNRRAGRFLRTQVPNRGLRLRCENGEYERFSTRQLVRGRTLPLSAPAAHCR